MSYYKLFLGPVPQTEWADNIFLAEMACGAVGGGLFLAGAVMNSAAACFLGLVLACGCKGLLLLKDLGRPERFLKVLLRPFGSWLSFGAWALMVFGGFGLILTIMLLMDANPGGGTILVKTLAILGALVLITYDGLLMSSSRGIAAWGSGLLAPLFAVNALASGAALLLPMYADTALGPVTMGLLTGQLVLLICHLGMLYGGNTGSRETLSILLSGDQKKIFLGGVLAGGTAVPLFITGALLAGSSVPSIILGFSGLLVVGGVVGLRASMLRSGVTTPVA